MTRHVEEAPAATSSTPWVYHEVIKVNRMGRRQKRTLAVSPEGVKNINGTSVQWFVPRDNIYSFEVKQDNQQAFTLKVISKYTFEAESPEIVRRIKHAFEQFGLGNGANTQTSQLNFGAPASAAALKLPDERRANAEDEPVDEYVSPIPMAGSPLTPDHFELLKTIGVGSFGKVFLVRKKDDGRLYAMKVLKKAELIKRQQVEHTLTEHRILAQLRHPFMVSLHYSFQTSDKLYMVLDFAQGGELFYHLGKAHRFPEVLAVFYTAEIILALNYLHRHDIIYRDLKPENILLDAEGHVLVTDFGLAKGGITAVGGDDTEGQAAHTFCGTPEYLAPEVLTGQGHGKAVDWWSVGVLLYEMLTGTPPFYAENRHEMYRNVMKAQLTFPSIVSLEAQDFLRRILVRRPQDRLGSGPGGVAEIQRHPLFRNINWTKLELKQVPPPFKPRLHEDDETANFDPQFTSQQPRDSVGEDPHITEAENDQFAAFGYSR